MVTSVADTPDAKRAAPSLQVVERIDVVGVGPLSASELGDGEGPDRARNPTTTVW